MANVPREFPPTPSLLCCVCEQCCEPISSHPNWKGAQGNSFPWEFTSIQYWGTPEGPQPPLHKEGEKQELGLGLEEGMLLSLSITAFITLTNTLHQCRKHLLSCWKASAHQNGSPKHIHRIPRVCRFAIFFGIHSLAASLQVWSREVAQAYCASRAVRRETRKAVSRTPWFVLIHNSPHQWLCPALDLATAFVLPQELGRQWKFSKANQAAAR